MSIINKNIKIFVIFIMCFSFGLTQTKTDARMLGMGGAYSTVANGYRTVGFNPANLDKSTDASVWPALTKTPPSLYLIGNM